jgi:hypothetical protein
MVASRETLRDLAAERQLQPATLERVIRLIDILDAFGADTLIGPRIALKGGTALNVFHSDLDHLSVDIDVNYVGAIEKERMDADRPGLEDRIERLMESKGYAARREPSEHAGGKWIYRYASALGGAGTIEIDINYLYRDPFTAWIVCRRRQSGRIEPRTCRFSTYTRSSPARWLRWLRVAPRAICSMRIGSSPCRRSIGRRSRRPP